MPSMRRQRVCEDFDEFVANSTSGLLRTAYLVVWDLGAAEDLVQECLFRIARHWPRVRAMEHPAAYARRIVVNLALDEAKRRSRQHSELDVAHRAPLEARQDEGATRALGMVETTSALIGALRELPRRQRATLVLRYFEDLPEAEVAHILGCSLGTVKSTSSRGLERLRRHVELAQEDQAENDLDPRLPVRHEGSPA